MADTSEGSHRGGCCCLCIAGLLVPASFLSVTPGLNCASSCAGSWKLEEIELSASDTAKLNDVGWVILQGSPYNHQSSKKYKLWLWMKNVQVREITCYVDSVFLCSGQVVFHHEIRRYTFIRMWEELKSTDQPFFHLFIYLFVVWYLKWSFLPYWNAFRNILPQCQKWFNYIWYS